MIWVGHAAYTDQFHELAKLLPHRVTPKSKRIVRYIYSLVLEICIMEGIAKKAGEKRRDDGEPNKQEDTRMNNKRAGTGMGFVATDPGKNKNMSYLPKCARCNSYHQESAPFRTCFTCS
ncbi:hypothetical protein Tco_1280195 [Tanacetum coccineum]